MLLLLFYCYITSTLTTTDALLPFDTTAVPLLTATNIPTFHEQTSNTSGAKPVNYSNQLWTDTLNNEILHQINLYCQQYHHSHNEHLL